MESRFNTNQSVCKFLGLFYFLLTLIFLHRSNISWETQLNRIPNTDLSQNATTPKRQLYFLKTSKCQIPYVDPFNDDVMKIYKPQTLVTCSNESDLITTSYNKYINRHVLHIDEKVALNMLNFTDAEYNCFYREIKYGNKADTYDK